MKALWKTKSRAELMADKVADNGREPNKYNYRIKNCSFSDLRCWWTRRWWWSPSTTGSEHLASSQQTHPGEDWRPNRQYCCGGVGVNQRTHQGEEIQDPPPQGCPPSWQSRGGGWVSQKTEQGEKVGQDPTPQNGHFRQISHLEMESPLIW